MTKKDLDGLEKVIVRVLNKEVVPMIVHIDKRLEKVEKDMENVATKTDIDRLERKFDSQQNRLDIQEVQIEELQKKTSLLA